MSKYTLLFIPMLLVAASACSGSDSGSLEQASTLEDMCEAYTLPACTNEGVFNYDECLSSWRAVEEVCAAELENLLGCLGEETAFQCTDQGPIPVGVALESGLLAAYCEDEWLYANQCAGNAVAP